MSKDKRRQLPAEKTAILRRQLVYKVSIWALCNEYRSSQTPATAGCGR